MVENTPSARPASLAARGTSAAVERAFFPRRCRARSSPMSRIPVHVAALALMAGLAPASLAQQPVKPAAGDKPQIHRMDIENGQRRTVHYFNLSGKPLDPGEESSLRNLEQAENGLAAAEQLQDLRSLYIRNEVALERRRGQVNPLLYGYSSEYGASSYDAGFGGSPYSYPYAYPYGFGGVGGYGSFSGSSSTSNVVNSIAPGIGNEGVIKNEMAKALTDPSASVAYERALRARDSALARLADTNIGKELKLVAQGQTVGPAVNLVMKKGNEKITGSLVSDDGEWITVDTTEGETSVRKADVDRIVYPKSNVKPAAR
jgi:hypothetical protein